MGVVKNQPVARRGLAAVLAVAVQVSAVTAPMAHVHLDDHETAHHHAREMHTHLSSHGSFTEAHILAITQAICDYRQGQGTDGPVYMSPTWWSA